MSLNLSTAVNTAYPSQQPPQPFNLIHGVRIRVSYSGEVVTERYTFNTLPPYHSQELVRKWNRPIPSREVLITEISNRILDLEEPPNESVEDFMLNWKRFCIIYHLKNSSITFTNDQNERVYSPQPSHPILIAHPMYPDLPNSKKLAIQTLIASTCARLSNETIHYQPIWENTHPLCIKRSISVVELG